MSDTELLHKSKPEPVRRLEVFTGVGRRRTWTAEQKAQILAESYESGENRTAIEPTLLGASTRPRGRRRQARPGQTKPVDFRRGADSLAALVREQLKHDPFSGTIYIFRSKRSFAARSM